MPVTVNWSTQVIYVPQSYLTPLGGVFYELDTDQFRLDLLALQSAVIGIVFIDTHRHNTEVLLSGDLYARVIEIINGYTVTFEDGQYVVRCVGSNHNIADVKNPNQVSLAIGNSAGLIRATTEDIASSILDALRAGYNAPNTVGEAINQIMTIDAKIDVIDGQTLPVYQPHQGWVENIIGNKMVLDVFVHKDGQLYSPTLGSTLDTDLYVNGGLEYSANDVAMDPQGFFQVEVPISSFSPELGTNFISVTEVTEGIGGDKHKSAVIVSRAAFTDAEA